MSVGLRVWDDKRNIVLDTTDHTARLVYIGVKAGTSSGSETIPEAVGKMPIVFTYPGPDNDNEGLLSVGIGEDGVLTWEKSEDHAGNTTSGDTSIVVYVCNERWVVA